MISKELVNLINSGEAIAIVGSGISAEAGLPSWRTLFDTIADALDGESRDTTKARATAKKGRLPQAFDLLAAQTSRAEIHKRTAGLIEAVTVPGSHHVRLADWPFRLHATTNYDHLIETASSGQLVPVGNRGAELYKVAGGAQDVVWHLHGGSRLSNDVSQLVVTKSDYDDFYPDSNVVQRLKAISTAHRCVFIGFGFNDEDFIHVLKAVGRLAHSGRPSFAFLGYEVDPKEAREHQARMRTDYNVEVIPYVKHGHDHSDLHRVLDGYEAFVVRRSISFGRPSRATPTYDAKSASLKVASSLDIAEARSADGGLRDTLVGARVLAHIRENPGGTDDDLEQLYRSGEPAKPEVMSCLSSLRKRGIVTPAPNLNITPAYQSKTEAEAARVELSADRFNGSLWGRALKECPSMDRPARERAVTAVSGFLEELCRERGLGVAQNLATSDVDQASRRAVSLIQQLPDHLAFCATRDEALLAVHLASGVLTRPSEAEAVHLGLLCQAYFGKHLVGASETLSKVDLDLIKGTCYVLDASVLVCLLAEGGEVHSFTSRLVADLLAAGAVLTTTDLFVDETTEHSGWAFRFVARYGEESQEVIAALRCLGDYRPNQFLRGYFLGSPPDSTFSGYFGRVLGMDKKDRVTSDVISERLRDLGIQPLKFDEWTGFEQDHLAQRTEVQEEIAIRRTRQGTYKHDRQTKAEAEVAIIIDGIRRGILQPPGGSKNDGFFVSSTRVVDRLPNLDRRICLLPEGLAQWLWSSQGVSPRHAELVFEQLLWELAQGGIEFVDRATLLRRFSGIVEAARADLETTTRDRRAYLVEKYGPDPDQAFADADPLDLPHYATEVQQEALDRMEQEVKTARKRELEARAEAKMSKKDRAELEKHRQRQRKRQRKAEKSERAAQSRTGKKRGRGSKKG
jgi:hypothetical protein